MCMLAICVDALWWPSHHGACNVGKCCGDGIHGLMLRGAPALKAMQQHESKALKQEKVTAGMLVLEKVQDVSCDAQAHAAAMPC